MASKGAVSGAASAEQAVQASSERAVKGPPVILASKAATVAAVVAGAERSASKAAEAAAAAKAAGPAGVADPAHAAISRLACTPISKGTLVIDESIITAGRGGDGGTGGVGGVGQGGASAGQGARGSCSFLGCGAGEAGRGGDGGGGGAGSQGGQGGGGAGGAAIGLFVDDHSNTVLVITQSEIRGGTGGNGGAGGYGGLSGEGASGRSPGTGLVPSTEANAAQPGSDGGSSYGLYIGGTPAENITIEGSDITGEVGGDPGDAPIPGLPGISAASND